MIDLIHGECLEAMARLPDASVDMVLCDLPYGTTACKWDSVIPFEPLWAQYRRIAKRNAAIMLTAAMPFTASLVLSNPKDFRYSLVWDKVGVTGFLDAKKRPMRRHEDIMVFGQGMPSYNPQMWQSTPYKVKRSGNTPVYNTCDRVSSESDGARYPTSVIQISNAKQIGKVHPTQKPVALMEYLIRTYTNEGDTVLDNTMGSGTTGVACVNTGRSFIGIERDDKYFAIAQDRIAQASHDLFKAA
jgi:DNA modification methylase